MGGEASGTSLDQFFTNMGGESIVILERDTQKNNLFTLAYVMHQFQDFRIAFISKC